MRKIRKYFWFLAFAGCDATLPPAIPPQPAEVTCTVVAECDGALVFDSEGVPEPSVPDACGWIDGCPGVGTCTWACGREEL